MTASTPTILDALADQEADAIERLGAVHRELQTISELRAVCRIEEPLTVKMAAYKYALGSRQLCRLAEGGCGVMVDNRWRIFESRLPGIPLRDHVRSGHLQRGKCLSNETLA